MRPIAAIFAAVVLVAAAALVVTGKLRITQLGYEVGATDIEIRKLEEQNRQFRAEVSRSSSYTEVAKLVKEFKLPLVEPQDGDARRASEKRAQEEQAQAQELADERSHHADLASNATPGRG